ncbi:MAG: hypothetical protein AAF849_02865 [Bacteroidota bacterium]
MIISNSQIIRHFIALQKEEQVKLAQILISYLAGTSPYQNKEEVIDLVAEEPHFPYKASIPVLSEDWDQAEDDHWDNY